MGGVRDIYLTIIVEALPTSKHPRKHLIAIHCVAAEHGGLITERRKFMVQIKAFPTNDLAQLSIRHVPRTTNVRGQRVKRKGLSLT